MIRNEPDLNAIAARLLAGKIQSQNTKESLLALDALEGNRNFSNEVHWTDQDSFSQILSECMDTLGTNFQIEVNKFKFLNELVKKFLEFSSKIHNQFFFQFRFDW